MRTATLPRLPKRAPPICVGGHEILPGGGHEAARWWPTNLPSGGQVICPVDVRVLSGPPGGCSSRIDFPVRTRTVDREERVKSREEIMRIPEAFDLMGSCRDGA